MEPHLTFDLEWYRGAPHILFLVSFEASAMEPESGMTWPEQTNFRTRGHVSGPGGGNSNLRAATPSGSRA
eukprot:9239052-Alexandrium_andersonii.AAC.1